MKNHKNIIVVILLLLFTVFLIYSFTFSKFASDISGKGNAEIATPIIDLVGSNKIVGKNYDDTAKEIEYNFSVNNFDSIGNINQVDLEYLIQIKNDNLEFPTEYQLYDGSNQKIELNNNITNLIFLDKDLKTSHKYKLIIKYANKGNGINIINKLNNLDITISAEQVR